MLISRIIDRQLLESFQSVKTLWGRDKIVSLVPQLDNSPLYGNIDTLKEMN